MDEIIEQEVGLKDGQQFSGEFLKAVVDESMPMFHEMVEDLDEEDAIICGLKLSQEFTVAKAETPDETLYFRVTVELLSAEEAEAAVPTHAGPMTAQ